MIDDETYINQNIRTRMLTIASEQQPSTMSTVIVELAIKGPGMTQMGNDQKEKTNDMDNYKLHVCFFLKKE